MRPSTGSVGDAYDNAPGEGFFATLECELLERRSFRIAIFRVRRGLLTIVAGDDSQGKTAA